MSQSEEHLKQTEMLVKIQEYIHKTSGLKIKEDGKAFMIDQKMDQRQMKFDLSELNEVLVRKDVDQKDFIQVNFNNGTKILITDTLIGFKPSPVKGLDLNKLPRVVTTPDLMSVFDSLEEAINSEMTNSEEVEVLRKVYTAIILGAEEVGFSLSNEKTWLTRLTSCRATA